MIKKGMALGTIKDEDSDFSDDEVEEKKEKDVKAKILL